MAKLWPIILLILRVLWTFFRNLFQIVEFFLEIAQGKRERGRRIDCFTKPDLRPRPDPFIYSQGWLYLRGIAFTWDNPDFKIVDPSTSLPVDAHALIAGKTYRVEIAVHNSSIMAADGTNVLVEVLRFGAGTETLDTLGTLTVNVPELGSAVAAIDWTTPVTGGHNCLRATLSHPDDANPLNNVGQHNTDTATPASPTRRLRFHVGNHGTDARSFKLMLNGYRLPTTPMRPTAPAERGGKDGPTERMSLGYLRRLQAANSFAHAPVDPTLAAILADSELVVSPGGEIETFVEMLPAKLGTGRGVVNVNVLSDGLLIGGITAYVEEG